MPPTSPTPIRAVLFDYGLVLSGPPSPRAWQSMVDSFGVDQETFHSAYWEFRHAYDQGVLSGSIYWDRVAERLGREMSPEQRDFLLEADVDLWTAPNQPMIDWAAQLQAAGIPTGILSNLGDAMERGILARFDWLGAFAHHTFSHRLLLAKPDPAIYAHAAAGLGVAPGHILFVDDRQDNIEAARAAGMHAIQYTSHEHFLDAMQDEGFGSLLTPATKV